MDIFLFYYQTELKNFIKGPEMNAKFKKWCLTSGFLLLIFVLFIVVSYILGVGLWECSVPAGIILGTLVTISAWEFSAICNKERSLFWKINCFIVLILPIVWILLDPPSEDEIFKMELPYEGYIYAGIYTLVLLIIRGHSSLKDTGRLAKDIFIGMILLGLGGGFTIACALTGDFLILLFYSILVVCASNFVGGLFDKFFSSNPSSKLSLASFFGGAGRWSFGWCSTCEFKICWR